MVRAGGVRIPKAWWSRPLAPPRPDQSRTGRRGGKEDGMARDPEGPKPDRGLFSPVVPDIAELTRGLESFWKVQAQIAPLLTRPVGRPPHYVRRSYASFRYRAQSWSRARRVVAKVEWHPGELYPRVGFIVTI